MTAKKVCFLVLFAVLRVGCQSPQVVTVERQLRGDTDVTFFVAADTHFGAIEGIAMLNRKQIASMNALPGTPYPTTIGGAVAEPTAVLIAGDLTDHGRKSEWKQFVKHYGLNGKDGMLKYPVYECTGNHDRRSWLHRPVLDGTRRRHGNLHYSWDWGDVHVICLDQYPDAANCRWLAKDLATVGKKVPIVIYFHYALLGPYSGAKWWRQREKARFRKTIQDYNVIAIFHGHFHGSKRYTWKGYDVYNVGSPRHGAHSFAVVRVTDTNLTVTSWNWDRDDWGWSHTKPIDTTLSAPTNK